MATRRRRRKRRGGNAFLSLLTFCVVIGAIITSVTVFLKVAQVEVTGSTRYEPKDIIETSGIKTGDNMFMINKFEVAGKILDRYPYIEQIKIRRRLPDTFTFEITERVGVAYIEFYGNRWLIDSNAYILEMLPKDTEATVPKITGALAVTPRTGIELILENEDQLPVLKEVLVALRYTNMIEKISRIELGKLYDINLVYDNRFLVALGDATLLSKKIEMLRAVIAQLTDFDKGTINVSAVKEARFKPDANIDLSEKGFVPQKEVTEEKVENAPEEEKGNEEKEN